MAKRPSLGEDLRTRDFEEDGSSHIAGTIQLFVEQG